MRKPDERTSAVLSQESEANCHLNGLNSHHCDVQFLGGELVTGVYVEGSLLRYVLIIMVIVT